MATIIPHTTRATGTLLTAAIYNADHQNHITNANSLNTELAGVVDVGVTSGIIVSNGVGVISGRAIDVANGIGISNNNGVTGNPTLSLGTLTGLTGIENFAASAVIKNNPGTVAAPSYSFQAEPGTGIYRSAAGLIDFSILGVNKLSLSASALTLAAGMNLAGVTASFSGTGAFTGVLSALSSIELGHASDTTLARAAAGFISVEGKRVPSPASQAQGDVLVRGATEWDRLAIGTAGQFLKVNAGATALEYGAAAVFTLAAAQATTSGTAFDFTSIPAGVSVIEVLFNDIVLSATDDLLIQLGDSGGIEATGYGSSSGIMYGGQSNEEANYTTGFGVYRGGTVVSGVMHLRRVSGNIWVSSHSFADSGDAVVGHGGGSKTLSATLDRVRLTRNGAATFTGGSVTIAYYS